MSDNNTPNPPAYFDNLFGGIEPQPLHWAQEPPAVVVTLTQQEHDEAHEYGAGDCPASAYVNGYLPGYEVPGLDVRGWSIYDTPTTI